MSKQPSQISSQARRTELSNGRAALRASKYEQDAVPKSTVKRQPAPSVTPTEDLETLCTYPTNSKLKVPGGPSGRKSLKKTWIDESSVAHLLSSRIASSNEEIMVLTIAKTYGFRHALAWAAVWDWKLSARFCFALLSYL